MTKKKRQPKRQPKLPPKGIRALWDQIPDIPDCQGKCDRSCGPITCTTIEQKLMEDRSGVKLDHRSDLSCTMLDQRTGRCTVYSIRPLICRLWGTTQTMRCPFGCTPTRWLDDVEAFRLLGEAMKLDGEEQRGQELIEGIEKMDAEVRAAFEKYVRTTNDFGGIIADKEKAREEFFEVLQRKGPVYDR